MSDKDDNWEMPQPVFKSSEGSLPRSLEETISTSFMANAETVEIDEDDDILGIMDASLPDQYVQNLAVSDEEDILETEPEIKTEPTPKTTIPADAPTTPNIDEPKPISVTAKNPWKQPKRSLTRLDLVFLLMFWC